MQKKDKKVSKKALDKFVFFDISQYKKKTDFTWLIEFWEQLIWPAPGKDGTMCSHWGKGHGHATL